MLRSFIANWEQAIKELYWNTKVLVSRVWQYRGGTDDGQLVHTGIVVLDQEGTHMYGQIPANSSGTAVPILASFPTGSATLVVLPLDEMNTPISAFKGKGQAIMPKTPSKSACPKSARRKLFTEPSKPEDTELSASAAKVASQAEQGAPAGNVVEATSVPNVGQETELIATEDPKNNLPDHTKVKRTNTAVKPAGAPKKANQ